MTRRLATVVVCGWLALSTGPAANTPPAQQDSEDGVGQLLRRIERIMTAGNPDAYLGLLSTYADRQSAREASRMLVAPTITRAVLRERDRMPLDGTLPGDGYRLATEVFVEYGDRARVSTWRFDVRRSTDDQGNEAWVVAGQQQLAFVDGLYRLSLDARRQYRVRNLAVRSEDLELRLEDGRMFVSSTQEGTMAVVLLARSGSRFAFTPSPETEREQVKLYAGTETIEDGFDAVFIRVNPSEFDEKFPAAALQAEPVDGGLLRRAQAVFKEDIGKSFSIDLADLSRESWSLSPSYGDFLVEARTSKYRTLTYAKSGSDPEDISVFDRRRRRNISVYPSRENIARRGRFFAEDALAPYDITDYLVEARFEPERDTMEGLARLRLKVGQSALNSLTLKLADSLTVRSVFGPDVGRLLFLRVRNQNSLVVNLPTVVPAGGDITISVEYGGPIEAAQFDHEAVSFEAGQELQSEILGLPGEQSRLYTTRTYWYPQASVTDYAPALLKLTVPEGFGVLASGEPAPGFPVAVAPPAGQRIGGRQFVFTASQPLRYLSCLISKFVRTDTKTIPLDDVLTPKATDGAPTLVRPVRPGVFYDALTLTVDVNPRLRSRGRRTAESAVDIVRFYAGLVGDSPYPSLAVGLIEKRLPGGHSPAYLSVLHHPLPATNYSWADDPASFPNYPEFFVAHEIAHQWWGQAVGWQSYHEQWISEGFAQYFAALFAGQRGGEQAFQDVMRRMARFAREETSQGPISLGYRLGHIRGNPRVFRALVYDKAAVVLHSLRTLLGDEVFFRGVRRFYFDWRFKKAATIDVQRAFEAESGQDLSVFFEEWIHSSGIPVVKFSWRRDGEGAGAAAVVRFEQVGSVFELPIPVTLQYADNTSVDVMVPVRQRLVEQRIPVTGSLRDVAVNVNGLALVDIYKEPTRRP